MAVWALAQAIGARGRLQEDQHHHRPQDFNPLSRPPTRRAAATIVANETLRRDSRPTVRRTRKVKKEQPQGHLQPAGGPPTAEVLTQDSRKLTTRHPIHRQRHSAAAEDQGP